MDPIVSVVIPVYNAKEYLEETIESVVNQSYKNIEIILVNNCSTDKDTITLLKRLSNLYKVVESEIKGLAQARNDGIQEASGEFILPLDADDLLKPDFVKRCIHLFQEKPELSLVRTHIELFGKKKGTIIFEEYLFAKLLARNLMTATSMFKKRDWERIGGYDNSFNICFEDWEFWINLLKDGGEVGTVDDTLFRYRIRKNSMMHSLNLVKLKEVRKNIWEKHKSLYGKYFVDPTESFEHKFVVDSKANRLGNILLAPFSKFKLMNE